ncbi:MAG: hypothetical protein WAM71_21045 [Candidatus Korobacteraceae bacterium]
MLRFRAIALVCSITLVCFNGFAQQQAPHPKSSTVAASKNEALIDALTNVPFGEVYSEDISNNNSITYFGKSVSENPGDGVVPAPQLRAIAELGQVAIPLLISHLTDQRPTRAIYNQQPVPVAYLALDLLLHMTDMNDERVVVPGCEQHGLGDCMQPEFYFSPDTKDPNTLASVQTEWTDENNKQAINFVYPPWWRPEGTVVPAPPASQR